MKINMLKVNKKIFKVIATWITFKFKLILSYICICKFPVLIKELKNGNSKSNVGNYRGESEIILVVNMYLHA